MGPRFRGDDGEKVGSAESRELSLGARKSGSIQATRYSRVFLHFDVVVSEILQRAGMIRNAVAFIEARRRKRA